MLDAGDIIVRPVNFAIIGNELVIRSKSGRKLWAAAGNAVVFEVDGYSTDGSSGWSVLVKGRSHVITLGAEALGARRAQIPAWAFPQTASQFISVEMSEITGRRFSHPAAATDHAEPANPVPEPADASNVAS